MILSFDYDIREIVPAVRVAERVGGLPFALVRTVVAEEKGIPEIVNLRLAGEEDGGISTFAERSHL